MTKGVKLLFTLFVYAGLAAAVSAETVYVSDNLRVGVRPEPDNGYTPVGVVTTGMRLKVIDRQKGFLKIETENGTSGWIKDIYVINEQPAILKLQQLQKRHAAMAAQLKETREALKSIESVNRNLNQQVDNLKQERSQLQLLQARSISSQQQARSVWYWWLVALALVISGGFFGGMQWYRHQAMKRLGGLRF